MATSPEAKLQSFLHWLCANGAELRGSTIQHCGADKGFGVFSAPTADRRDDGIVMTIPLDLAITPMRVLQDPFVGPRCRALFEEGHVDDRFLVMIFLTVERLRPDSQWKPYLDMLPSTFGNPLWFSEEELAELKGTTLYQATMLQKKNLRALYDDKAKALVEELLSHDPHLESVNEVHFEDFLWANSVFWTRALNIPLPHCYVFPESLGGQEMDSACKDHCSGVSVTATVGETCLEADGPKIEEANNVSEKRKDKDTSNAVVSKTIWVEGLVPGIDFCNHGVNGRATWEVDGDGSVTGIPASMYLILAESNILEAGKEILISYGNKGNEELLYLYGFVIDNNPDDYLMVHYPMEAFQNVPFADRKAKLLEIQKAEFRCLLPRCLLCHGFFPANSLQTGDQKKNSDDNLRFSSVNYSWSGQRKVPSTLKNLVFPQEFLTTLRTISMQEDELCRVASLLEELAASREAQHFSDREVQAAVWEVCGDYGALQLLVDLLSAKIIELEEGSGNEDWDTELLEKFRAMELQDLESESSPTTGEFMNKSKWSSIVYRKGQKQLARLFLKEAEHALEMCTTA
ncbi:putative [Fructose-bisphosphate aldolase]-lysine N-methyltransferase [Dioscorea sansibarensis]